MILISKDFWEITFHSRYFTAFFQGPFTTFKVENEAKEDWTGLKFSPDGKMIMVTTNGSSVTLIDSFKGTLVHVLRGLFSSFDICPKLKIIQIFLYARKKLCQITR